MSRISIYLASPYAHADESIRRQRVELVNEIAMRLIEQGYVVFSPLSHTVPISKYQRDKDKLNRIEQEEVWLGQDAYWVPKCDELWVVQQEGWEDSRGVCAETMLARALNMPVKYIRPFQIKRLLNSKE